MLSAKRLHFVGAYSFAELVKSPRLLFYVVLSPSMLDRLFTPTQSVANRFAAKLLQAMREVITEPYSADSYTPIHNPIKTTKTTATERTNDKDNFRGSRQQGRGRDENVRERGM